ncbi:MAG: HD domain-containing protein [Armatimonadetes bacterium]|nr:HD domain-containing protein [Armatimonadota bacterium]
MKMGPEQLLAAASYAIDMLPGGCRYHGWRVALLAACMADSVASSISDDVFLAGLIHDASVASNDFEAAHSRTIDMEFDHRDICIHPRKSAAMMRWLPDMQNASDFILSHHEWWSGFGYPSRLAGNDIPLGGQLLHIAESADAAGCFIPGVNLVERLSEMVCLTGLSWSKDIWAVFVKTINNAEFYQSLCRPSSLNEMITQKVANISKPQAFATEECLDKAFHLFPMLVDAKDLSAAGHSLQVARYAFELAKKIELSNEDCRMTYRAGLVHDCGRLGLSDKLVHYYGRMEENDLKLIREHAAMTIRAFACLPDCKEMAYMGLIAGHHHERYDGAGYPSGMLGDDIPIICRILSVADAYDSMRSPKSYRLLSPKAALVRLRQGAGTQFDPVIVEAMVNAVNMGEITPGLSAAA